MSEVRVTAPDTFRVVYDSDAGERRRRGPSLPDGPISLEPTEGLGVDVIGAGFELVDTVVLEPTLEPTAPTGVRRRSAPAVPDSQVVSLSVDTAPGEEAVVLVEQDGVYSWVFPDELRTDSTRSGLERDFSIGVGVTSSPETETRGFVSDIIYSKLTAKVLKFIAPVGVRAVVSHFEDSDERIVIMSEEGPASWRHVEPEEVRLTPGARVLLFVHGTFSSTLGSFAALWSTEDWRRLLVDAWQTYDVVIGVDHRSLSVDPLVNAEEILSKLMAIPGAEQLQVDALGYSRGGLVLRSLVERVVPASGWDAQFGRVVFVGSTHEGTNLASPVHWRQLIDLYTNLVVAGATGASVVIPGAAAPAAVVATTIKIIGAAVKTLATESLDEDLIPGLAAMRPFGPFVTDLNERQSGQPAPGEVDYFAITSDFEPDQSAALNTRLKAVVSDQFMDQLMTEANDLVVNTSSMTGFEAGYLADSLAFGTNGEVMHTNYFSQPDVARALSGWWQTYGEQAAIEAPRTRSVLTDNESVEPDAASGEAESETLLFSAGMGDGIHVGAITSVEVSIGDILAAGLVAGSAEAEVSAGRPVVVQVMCREGFVSVGEKRAEVPYGQAMAGVQMFFDVEATDEGRGHIDVVFRQGVVPLATVSLAPVVVPIDQPGQPVAATAMASSAPALAIPLHQLRISERLNNGQISYDFDFESEELGILIAASSPPLHADRDAWVAQLFAEIEQRWLGSGEDSDAFLQEMRAYGSSLFSELMPLSIQEALWEHRGAISAIQVLSSEPFVPWEIVHLKEPGGSLHPSEDYFLGSMGLVRWLHGSWPPSEIHVRPGRVKAVVPFYPESTPFRLPQAEAELGFMQTTFGADQIAPTARAFRDLISQPGSFDLLHFAGHGTAEQSSVGQAKLMMEGRIEGTSYVPEYINATTVSEFANLRGQDGNRPIVVLNACQVGRLGYQLTSIGGFAAAFTGRGAGAFVSSLWSVGDRPARTFTETWYNQLLSGQSVTEATIAARSAARAAGDATWLAYTVYAHPHAVVVPN